MPNESRDPWSVPLYNALKQRLVPDLEPPPPGSPFMMGGRWYRQVDNGRADTLAPVDDPTVPPVQRAQRRAAIKRAFLMANSPMAGGAYGLATLAGASPEARNRAMMAGGTVDAVMEGVAPLGVRHARATGYRPAQPLLSTEMTIGRKPIRYGRTTESGQATAGDATITRSMIGTGEGVNDALKPPGWPPGRGGDNNVGRGHVMARNLGGAASSLDQVFTITQNPTNHPQMSGYEADVARRVRQGEVVDYFVRPLYDAPNSAPSMILMSAQGSRGDFTPRLIPNPIGGRR